MAKSQDTMRKNTEASIKNLDMQISQLSRQVATKVSSSGEFVGNMVDNPKNESCKAIELRNRVIPSNQKVSDERK